MKNVPMRFCGYTLHHNPATLKIESVSNIRELNSPCCEPRGEYLGKRLRRISGEGELYGDNSLVQFRELHALLEKGEAGLLSLPHLPAIHAYLTELRMTAEPNENVLGYRFEFRESQPPADGKPASDYYVTIVNGESLWDISYRYRVSIDELVRLNPQIRYIDALEEGERVRLC